MTVGYPTGQKLAAYCLVDGTNKTEVQQAMWLAESLYFGVGLPDAWVNPFPSAGGFTWQDGDPDLCGQPSDPENARSAQRDRGPFEEVCTKRQRACKKQPSYECSMEQLGLACGHESQ